MTRPVVAGPGSRQTGERGQSLVEFAVILPVLLLLIMGIVDGGRVIFAYNGMSEAARNVARVAAVTCFETSTACSNPTITAAIDAQQVNLPGGGTFTVRCVLARAYTPVSGSDTYPSPSAIGRDCMPGDLVEVTVSASFTPITPMISQVFGTRTLSSTSRTGIEQ